MTSQAQRYMDNWRAEAEHGYSIPKYMRLERDGSLPAQIDEFGQCPMWLTGSDLSTMQKWALMSDALVVEIASGEIIAREDI